MVFLSTPFPHSCHALTMDGTSEAFMCRYSWPIGVAISAAVSSPCCALREAKDERGNSVASYHFHPRGASVAPVPPASHALASVWCKAAFTWQGAAAAAGTRRSSSSSSAASCGARRASRSRVPMPWPPSSRPCYWSSSSRRVTRLFPPIHLHCMDPHRTACPGLSFIPFVGPSSGGWLN